MGLSCRSPFYTVVVVCTIAALLLPAGGWVHGVQGAGYDVASSASDEVRAHVQAAQAEALARAPETRQEFLRFLGEALGELGAKDGAWFGLEDWPLDDALYWVVESQDGWSSIPVIPPSLRVWIASGPAVTASSLFDAIPAHSLVTALDVRVLGALMASMLPSVRVLWRMVPPARAP